MSRGNTGINKDMSEEKKYDRNYREPSAKLALKTGVKRASQPETKGVHCTFSLT